MTLQIQKALRDLADDLWGASTFEDGYLILPGTSRLRSALENSKFECSTSLRTDCIGQFQKNGRPAAIF